MKIGKTGLSPREQEVLALLARGLTSKEITEQLNLSYWTVETHVAGISRKRHVPSRTQAVARYLQEA